MKDGSSDVQLGEAWKVCPTQCVVAVASLDQPQKSYLLRDHLSLGLSAGRNGGQWVEPDAGCPGSDGFIA